MASSAEYFMPGDIIYEGDDFAHVIFKRYKTEYCDYCCLSNTNVKLCSKCLYVGYCNRNCQVLAWPSHKLECKNMAFFVDHPDADVILFLARIIRRLESLKGKPLTETVGSRTITLYDLETFADHQNAINVNFCNLITGFSRGLQAYLAFAGMSVPENDAFVITSQILYNRGMLRGDKEFGMFFCLGRAIFGFSCLPNAVDILDNKNSIIHQIRATQKIPKDHLDKVYLPTLSVVESFCPDCHLLSECIHFKKECRSCNAKNSAVSRVLQKGKAHKILNEAKHLVARILRQNCEGDAETLRAVDCCLKKMTGILPDTHKLRLLLFTWKVLFYHPDIAVAEQNERSFIQLIESLYGEQSYELYEVYHHLVVLYAERKEFKAAKDYKAKRNKIGSLYGLMPFCMKDDDIIEENDKSSSTLLQ